MIDTGTGKGQVAGSQGAGIDLNWKPIAYGVNEEEIFKNLKKAKMGRGSFTIAPFIKCLCVYYQMFVCLSVPALDRGQNGWTQYGKIQKWEQRGWQTGEIQRNKEA